MRAGSSVATTMGFTALDGLPMGTRCGSLDPGVMLYLMDELGMDARGDRDAALPAIRPARRVGHLERHAHAGSERTIRAREGRDRSVRLPDRARARLARGGAGRPRRDRLHRRHRREQRGDLRARVCADASWLGVELDRGGQCQRAGRGISASASRVAAWVIPTNEELMIARHTWRTLALQCGRSRP